MAQMVRIRFGSRLDVPALRPPALRPFSMRALIVTTLIANILGEWFVLTTYGVRLVQLSASRRQWEF
jgi:hypothetical protein